MEDQLSIDVTIDGRPANREDVTTGHTDVPVRFHRADSLLFAGFRMNWIDGEDPKTGATFALTAGAGVGSAYLTLTVGFRDGETVREYVDISDVLTDRLDALIAEHETPAEYTERLRDEDGEPPADGSDMIGDTREGVQ